MPELKGKIMSFNQNNGAQSHDGSLPRPGSAWSGSYPAATPQGGTAGAAYDAAAAGDGASSPYGGPPPAGDGTALPKKRRWYRSGKVWAIILAAVVVIGVIGSRGDSETATHSSTTRATSASTSDGGRTTAEESQEATPSEEATGEPEAPAESEAPSYESMHFEGTGADVITVDGLDNSILWVAQATHSGYSNFAVWPVDASGQDIDLLVNEIGSYSGSRLLNAEGDPAAIRIEADGTWSIDVIPYTDAPAWDMAQPYTGHGDTVVRITGDTDSLTTVHLTHAGQSNFIVIAYDDGDWFFPLNLMVNEIGSYDGRTVLPNGTTVLDIMADGDWSITAE
ncbi:MULTISPECIES: hypothetical protein [unclassified Actinobaculum]|uniref:hypothetical protein n=1 Tax=unclassified Actinobaculum TaxID=2609299 RepID=UPI000D525DD8|nr:MULTISPECIES: hypothetical protein [unclassified Actinobaculum]AWE42662.1 hypothetical protein DDD63_07775 [Actinobaculum sp. 313]RTE49469.1 hypothetical protein EKN07_05265 [Actinobaculum sp. 352]